MKLGRTSITMNVAVDAERGTEILQVTDARWSTSASIQLERKPLPLVPAGRAANVLAWRSRRGCHVVPRAAPVL